MRARALAHIMDTIIAVFMCVCDSTKKLPEMGDGNDDNNYALLCATGISEFTTLCALRLCHHTNAIMIVTILKAHP